jgi:hypothetical protein
MKALFRIVMTSWTLALALPLLAASTGCDDCEDMCQRDYDDCMSSGDEEERERCASDLNQCAGTCVAESRDQGLY